MQIKAEEISSIIKEKIKGFDQQVDVSQTGSVIQVGDGIAKIYGLDGAMAGEMLEFPGGLYGIALNLEEDNVGAVLMGDDVGIKEGDPVKRTGRIAEIPVGEALIGRVVNALGQPIDGKGPIDSGRPEKQLSPSTPSSTRRASVYSVSTSPSVRSVLRLRGWSRPSKKITPWNTPWSWRRRPAIRRRCSSWPPSPAPRSVNISATTASMR